MILKTVFKSFARVKTNVIAEKKFQQIYITGQIHVRELGCWLFFSFSPLTCDTAQLPSAALKAYYFYAGRLTLKENVAGLVEVGEGQPYTTPPTSNY